MVAILQRILFRGNSATRVIHSTSILNTIASSLPLSSSVIGLHYCQITRDFSSEFSDLRPGERIVINPSSHHNKGGAKKSKITPKKSPPFIDKIRLRVRGGMGGAGEIFLGFILQKISLLSFVAVILILYHLGQSRLNFFSWDVFVSLIVP